MAIKRVSNIEIENATLIFLNFKGEKSLYNAKGDRNFGVIIDDPELAKAMIEDGWNVRILKPRDEGDEPRYYISVSVNFNFWKQPEVFMICGRVKTPLDEESIDCLDAADIVNVDLTIRPRQWTDDDGEVRIKAYLQDLYVTIERSRFASKYEDME